MLCAIMCTKLRTLRPHSAGFLLSLQHFWTGSCSVLHLSIALPETSIQRIMPHLLLGLGYSLRVDYKICITKLRVDCKAVTTHVILKLGGEAVKNMCFTHLYSLIDPLSISNSFFLSVNFTMPSTAPYARCEQNVLGFHWTIDAQTILWGTTILFLPIFRSRRKPREITVSNNGNWANQQKTHRYSSQLQSFLLQRIQRNRALAVRQFDMVNLEKMSRKIKPWMRRYRCVSGLLCQLFRSTLLRICCEGGRGKLR
jgi:hypothetical protein